MANYLLTAQTLLTLSSGGLGTPAALWFASEDTDVMRVSVISIATARERINQETDPTLRARADASLSNLLSSIEADGGPPLSFELGHAQAWQALISEPTLAGMGPSNKQVLATAMHDGLTVVEEAGPLTRAAMALGISVHEI